MSQLWRLVAFQAHWIIELQLLATEQIDLQLCTSSIDQSNTRDTINPQSCSSNSPNPEKPTYALLV